jgi:hypothetical protein
MRIWKDSLTEEEKFKLSVVFLDYQDQLAPDFMNIFIDLDDWLRTL